MGGGVNTREKSLFHSTIRSISIPSTGSIMVTTLAEERLSRLEGAYDHAATKADLFQLGNRLASHMGQLESRLMRWMVSLMIAVTLVALVAIGIFVQTLLD